MMKVFVVQPLAFPGSAKKFLEGIQKYRGRGGGGVKAVGEQN